MDTETKKARAGALAKPVASTSAPATGITRFVYIAVVIAALCGLLFGYDTRFISGAILFFKGEFALLPTMEEMAVRAAAGGALTRRIERRWLTILADAAFTLSAIDGAGAKGLLADPRAGRERQRHRYRLVYPAYVYRRIGAGLGPRLAGRSQHAGDHDRHRRCLSRGLWVLGEPRVAHHV